MFRVALALVLLAGAQDDKKGPPPDPKPRISMALPLHVVPGTTAKVVLRGLNLDQATEVKFPEPIEGASVTIKGKGKAEIPKETDPAVYGDTKVELEVKLPAELAAEKVSLVAVNAAGETKPHELVVLAKATVVPEKEPNGGFATAQPVESGQVVQGAISQALDVDVFKFTGKKGESWTIEVEANRRGSILDAMLTVHTQAGNTLVALDDSASSRDPSVKLTLPADGTYFVTLMDAHNSGGATHVYLLRLRRDN